MKTISVFIPTFNRIEPLKNAVSSVLNQNVDVDLHILDNCSSDGTKEWLKELEKVRGVRVTFRPENIGGLQNFADGFATANGKFVVPLADDDILLPGFLQKALQFIEVNNEVGGVVFQSEVFSNGSVVFISPTLDKEKVLQPVEHLAFWATNGHYFCWSSVVWSKELLDEIDVSKEMLRFGAFSDAWIQFLAFSRRPFWLVNQNGARLNIHSDQASNNVDRNYVMNCGLVLREMSRQIVQFSGVEPNHASLFVKTIGEKWNQIMIDYFSNRNNPIQESDVRELLLAFVEFCHPNISFKNSFLIPLLCNVCPDVDVPQQKDEARNVAPPAKSCQLKITVFSDEPGFGGVGHYTHSLLKYLVGLGEDVTSAQPEWISPLIEEQSKLGVRHIWMGFNPVQEFARSFSDKDDARRIIALAQPDVIFFSDCCPISHLAAKEVAMELGIPFIISCAVEAPYLAERFTQVLPLAAKTYACASDVIGSSLSVITMLRELYGMSAAKGKVIYYGRPAPYFQARDEKSRVRLRSEFQVQENDILFLTPTRVVYDKGHYLIIEALRQLKASKLLPRNWKYIWIGEGDLLEEYKKVLVAEGLDSHVQLIGYRWDLIDWLSAADVFLLTSKIEAVPLCVMEAMAKRLPVIASGVAGVPEELGNTGILLPDPNVDAPGTVRKLVEVLPMLAGDADLRSSMGQACHERASILFREEEMCRKTLELIKKAVNESASSVQCRKMNALSLSGELTSNLLNYRAVLEKTSADSESGELPDFPEEEVVELENLIRAWQENPADANKANQLLLMRQNLASFLSNTKDEIAGPLFAGSYGRVYRLLLQSGLQEILPTETEAGVRDFLAGGFDEKGDFHFLRLAASMLFDLAHRYPPFQALEVLPNWFLRDYLAWVFTPPSALLRENEAESYVGHLAEWIAEISRRLESPDSLGLPNQEMGSFVLGRINLIPAYCAPQTNRELMNLRGKLLEQVLTLSGAQLDLASAGERSSAKGKASTKAKGKRERWRIGILNAHFGHQTETYVTLPAMHLDPDRFEVFLFAGFANPGPVEEHSKSLGSHFTILPEALPAQVQKIRLAQLDVLIVGTNITAVTNQMSLLAAHRLAPVQILSHCSPMTSGLQRVDGFLSGSLAYREGASEGEFCEKLILLDGPPVCLDYTAQPGGNAEPFTRERLGLRARQTVFLNAASCFKIPIELMHLWARVLQAVPESKLVLMPFNPNWARKFPQHQFVETFRQVLAKHGVEKERVIFTGSFFTRAEVMRIEALADVYLDTLPFAGSISTVDPLELGIPVVACDGETTRSRCSGAQLREIGLPELVAQDAEGYLEIAIDLGRDEGKRRVIANKVREAMARKPRFLDPAEYGRQLGEKLEVILTQGWEALPKTKTPELKEAAAGAASAKEKIAKAPPSIDPTGKSVGELLVFAREAVDAGRGMQAEDLCRHVLERAPETAAAWALLGELARRSGDLNRAAELVGQALDLDSDNADFWCTLGEIRRENKDPDGALDALRRALELRPAFPNAWLMIAIVHDERKEPAQAEKAYGQALLHSKDRVETARIRVNFAGFLREQKRMKEAIKQVRKAVSAVPDSCETMLLLGSFLQEGGDLVDAMSTFSRVTKKFPGNGRSWLEWGKTLLLLGKPGEAVEKMRKAVTCQPDDPDALFNLGFALQRNIQRTESLQVYLDAERAGCDTGDLHTNIGVILKDQERYMEAAQRFHKGFERNPESHAAMNNLGAVCINLGLTTEAIECFQHALRLNPTMSAPHSNLGHMLKISGKAAEGMDYYIKGLKLDPENKEMMHNYLLSTLYQINFSPQEIFEEHRKWGARLAAGIKCLPRRHVRDGRPQGKIRIGYVSPDLCLHPVAFFAAPLMCGHDRGRFEVYAYADVHKEDAVTARFRSAVDVWHDITEMQNPEVGELMQKDEIDILVDLCGHTAHNRLEVLAARPAPIIASYLGYPATTGMPGVDFRITDAIADPVGQTDAWHTEKLVRLDRCAWCFEPPANTPPVGPLPADNNGFITFGCFNNLAKLNAPLYDAWVKILGQVPDSRLFLKAKTLIDPGVCQEVRDYFTARGISPDRLRVSGFEASPTCHFDRYNEVDIALDSYPYHGTTTTCEALWMGVPVVTRAGEAHLSRVGASLLHAVGHPELVASAEEEYIRLAVELARDPARLRALRAGLRGQMQPSPLLDQAGFIRALEAALLSLLPR